MVVSVLERLVSKLIYYVLLYSSCIRSYVLHGSEAKHGL